MNLFRISPELPLDRKYLRVCSVYRLLRRGIIGRKRAFELLAERHTETEMKPIRGLVDLWKSGPIKDMSP